MHSCNSWSMFVRKFVLLLGIKIFDSAATFKYYETKSTALWFPYLWENFGRRNGVNHETLFWEGLGQHLAFQNTSFMMNIDSSTLRTNSNWHLLGSKIELNKVNLPSTGNNLVCPGPGWLCAPKTKSTQQEQKSQPCPLMQTRKKIQDQTKASQPKQYTVRLLHRILSQDTGPGILR